jgi:hypothetical protein
MAVGRIDQLEATDIESQTRREFADPSLRRDDQGLDQSRYARRQGAPQRRFIAGVDHRAGSWRPGRKACHPASQTRFGIDHQSGRVIG